MPETTNHGLPYELETTAWLNTPEPLKLSDLKGKVVVIHAFQMLCPGCVSHSIPQAIAMHQLYANDDVQVIGLHTVFEHHNVMNIDALKAFISEYRLPFPVAVDQPSTSGPIPLTMEKYQMQGTPTLLVFDKQGRLRLNNFGRLNDMQVGDLLGRLLTETTETLSIPQEEDLSTDSNSATDKCGNDGCLI